MSENSGRLGRGAYLFFVEALSNKQFHVGGYSYDEILDLKIAPSSLQKLHYYVRLFNLVFTVVLFFLTDLQGKDMFG